MNFFAIFTKKDVTPSTSLFYKLDKITDKYSPILEINHLTCSLCIKYDENKAIELLSARKLSVLPKMDHFVTFDGWRLFSEKFRNIVESVAPRLVTWYPISTKRSAIYYGSIHFLAKCSEGNTLECSNKCDLCGRYESVLEGNVPLKLENIPDIVGLPFEDRFCSSPRWLVSDRIKAKLEAAGITNIDFHRYYRDSRVYSM
ncbi:hypothetical protein KIH39_21265 [Telmatocola sphagniphila]|uniref:Uncharacterized protein n=1 Tax=Telmatocola sphagniphila TaxID=1123043 RepID=A0A8E6B435_9BACT|nr:hypothetical protein [Telmatocola sphagniphila]QVL31351.1 hypothetical protein KIH39_21265 [Telmatocola sphagniphila]